MKQCSKCKETKELEMFSKKTASPDGKRSWCKACDKKYTPAKKKNYKERFRMNKVGDDYILGVISGKLGIDKQVKVWLRSVYTNPDRFRLYRLGMKDCDLFELKDLRNELFFIWKSNPDVLRKIIGTTLYSEVVLACHGLTEEEIRQKEKEIKEAAREASAYVERLAEISLKKVVEL